VAGHFGHHADPVHRQSLADLWIHRQVDRLNVERASQRLEAGGLPGPEGSINRLSATANLTRMAEAVASMLGPRVTADTGEWGTYAWTEQLLGAPGYHIAGGSDEIQHNIIGERVLGLPREPR
jgi:alkylation response protein AidB-like acyl-CoA dehydrogenase